MDNVHLDDEAFLSTVVASIPGWLEDYTGLRSMDVLRLQEERGLAGSILEIGVFAGRYFSILFRSALKQKSTIVGLDTFQYADVEQVQNYLRSVYSCIYDKLRFIKGRSTDWHARMLLEELGEPARFISIDGSHEKSDVFWDLRLAEELTSAQGIVAVDDYLNPMTLGVNEAVNHFFLQPRNLVPWAYIANKLFLSRPGSAHGYKSYLEKVVMEDRNEGRSKIYQKNLANGRHFVEVILFGNPIIILP